MIRLSFMTFILQQIILKRFKKRSKWVTQWKIIIIPDSTKQAEEGIFSSKIKNSRLLFNNANVTGTCI